jgi:hypothetical protein
MSNKMSNKIKDNVTQPSAQFSSKLQTWPAHGLAFRLASGHEEKLAHKQEEGISLMEGSGFKFRTTLNNTKTEASFIFYFLTWPECHLNVFFRELGLLDLQQLRRHDLHAPTVRET